MNIEKSIAFIESRGSELEIVRLHCILYGGRAPKSLVQDLNNLQNADGGFPFGMHPGNLSTINETTMALWWLEELDLLISPIAHFAFDYLICTQQADGYWDEDPRLAEYKLPPWIRLGDVYSQLYLTAYVAYWLAAVNKTSQPAFRKALNFLIRNQDETGRFLGYLHTTWIATAVFLMVGKRYSVIASKGLKMLSDRRLSEWEDSQLAWALDCLSKAGLPKNEPFISAGLNELNRRQKMDGSWASEDGEASSVSATIQALKVLRRYGLITADLKGGRA
ncbi:MAG TPA: prenyltransferase/squalene oxidase repeat-containing protein [Anaerolineales bacterium]|nr:prenyltransferase/squalene oxidase repeat-containing protein [Anaerolineales bacterium]